MKCVRGMKDVFGTDGLLFNEIIKLGKRLAVSNGFETLHTPILEFSEVFERNLGEESDIVSKEIYKFKDRSDNSLALRPEFTAGIMRHAVENSLHKGVLPVKYFSYGPLFRYDRPQKGRYRQFNQLNFEYIGGSDKTNIDLYIINLAHELLKALKIEDVTLKINALPNNKDQYLKELYKYLTPYKDRLSEDSQNRLEKNPLRILDSKSSEDKSILEDAPQIKDFLSEQESKDFEMLTANLSSLGIKFEIDANLVRGLDYYTSTIFEFVPSEIEFSQSTILAGGRYDNLFKDMSGGQTQLPCVGFSAGVERLMLFSKLKPVSKTKTALIYVNETDIVDVFNIANKFNSVNLPVDVILSGNSVIKRIKKADQIGCKYAIIIGEAEKQDNIFMLKNLQTQLPDFDGTIEDLIKWLINSEKNGR